MLRWRWETPGKGKAVIRRFRRDNTHGYSEQDLETLNVLYAARLEEDADILAKLLDPAERRSLEERLARIVRDSYDSARSPKAILDPA
jgi:hypothetical protein